MAEPWSEPEDAPRAAPVQPFDRSVLQATLADIARADTVRVEQDRTDVPPSPAGAPAPQPARPGAPAEPARTARPSPFAQVAAAATSAPAPPRAPTRPPAAPAAERPAFPLPMRRPAGTPSGAPAPGSPLTEAQPQPQPQAPRPAPVAVAAWEPGDDDILPATVARRGHHAPPKRRHGRASSL